jgi:hypothetical protein
LVFPISDEVNRARHPEKIGLYNRALLRGTTMAILTAEFWAKIVDRMFRVLEKQGLATVLVIAVGWFTAVELLIPLRDAGIRFLDRMATSTEATSEAARQLSIEVGSLSDSMGNASDSIERIEQKLSKALPN